MASALNLLMAAAISWSLGREKQPRGSLGLSTSRPLVLKSCSTLNKKDSNRNKFYSYISWQQERERDLFPNIIWINCGVLQLPFTISCNCTRVTLQSIFLFLTVSCWHVTRLSPHLVWFNSKRSPFSLINKDDVFLSVKPFGVCIIKEIKINISIWATAHLPLPNQLLGWGGG